MSKLSFLKKKKKPAPQAKLTTEQAVEEMRRNMDMVDFEMMMAGYSVRNRMLNPGPEWDRG